MPLLSIEFAVFLLLFLPLYWAFARRPKWQNALLLAAGARQPRLSCRRCRAVRLGAPYRLPTGAPAAKTRQELARARRFRLPLVSRRVQILRLLPPLSAKLPRAKRNRGHPDAHRRVVLHLPIHRLSGGNPPRPAGQAVHMGKPAAAPELFPHHHIGPYHPRRAVSK